MNGESSYVVGRSAALAVAVATIVFAIALVWEVIVPSEIAKNLGYIASLLIAISVVVMMASFYAQTREHVRIPGLLS